MDVDPIVLLAAVDVNELHAARAQRCEELLIGPELLAGPHRAGAAADIDHRRQLVDGQRRELPAQPNRLGLEHRASSLRRPRIRAVGVIKRGVIQEYCGGVHLAFFDDRPALRPAVRRRAPAGPEHRMAGPPAPALMPRHRAAAAPHPGVAAPPQAAPTPPRATPPQIFRRPPPPAPRPAAPWPKRRRPPGPAH